jgi:hypothetical protein
MFGSHSCLLGSSFISINSHVTQHPYDLSVLTEL